MRSRKARSYALARWPSASNVSRRHDRLRVLLILVVSTLRRALASTRVVAPAGASGHLRLHPYSASISFRLIMATVLRADVAAAILHAQLAGLILAVHTRITPNGSVAQMTQSSSTRRSPWSSVAVGLGHASLAKGLPSIPLMCGVTH